MIANLPVCALLLILLLLAGCGVDLAAIRPEPGPQPGEVFREFTYARRFGEVDPQARHPSAQEMKRSAGRPRKVFIDSLEGAVGAEVSIQYWGGHCGTAGQKFRVNESEWFDIPQPQGTPTEPQCYYRTVVGDNPVPIPLKLLRTGSNMLQFTAGKQIRHGFRWGMYWVYSFTVRIYYEPSHPHVAGRIASPAPGQAIGERPTVTAEIDAPPEKVKQVDFLALYEDYDWEGNGLFRQWHWQFKDGVVARHLGTATKPPWSIRWDTTWIPDQDEPIAIAARIVADDGTVYLTPAVANVSFRRQGRSVKMFRSHDVPEAFGVRIGKRMTCTIEVPRGAKGAAAARLLLSTWSAAHAEQIGLNGEMLVERVGPVHDYSFDWIDVPLRLIHAGVNKFFIYSSTEHHAAEVNWPGPVLVIEYRRDQQPAAD